MALHMRGCLVAVATGTAGLVVVEEEGGDQGGGCRFCSVEEAVKVGV